MENNYNLLKISIQSSKRSIILSDTDPATNTEPTTVLDCPADLLALLSNTFEFTWPIDIQAVMSELKSAASLEQTVAFVFSEPILGGQDFHLYIIARSLRYQCRIKSKRQIFLTPSTILYQKGVFTVSPILSKRKTTEQT